METVEELRAQIFADVAALMNDQADMWEKDGGDPCRVRITREFANAYRTYAEGVGVPSIDTLRRKRREAEAEVERLRRLTVPLTDLVQELGMARQSLRQAVLRASEAEAEVRNLRLAIEKEHCAACGNGMGLCRDCEAEAKSA